MRNQFAEYGVDNMNSLTNANGSRTQGIASQGDVESLQRWQPSH